MTDRRLAHLAEVRFSSVDKKTVDGQVRVQLCNYVDVYYNEYIGPGLEFMEASATLEQVRDFELKQGDVLLTKDSETAEDIGVSACVRMNLPGVVSGYHLALIRPRSDVDGRYLRWALSSRGCRSQLEVAATGVTRFGLRQEAVAALAVPSWPLALQRSIADYLDVETARIDELVADRQQMVRLLDERAEALATLSITGQDWPLVPIKWIAETTVGIVVRPSELYADSGAPCVRGFNVSPGEVSDEGITFISDEANEANAKSRLHAGDVIVVRTGNAGAAAVVPEWLDGGNCVDLLIVRRTSRLLPRFLELVLNSHFVRGQIAEESVGALQAHFNTESLSGLRVPAPDIQVQRATVQALDRQLAQVHRLRAAQAQQVDLLQERRQALITAAVTGQLEIPGVAA